MIDTSKVDITKTQVLDELQRHVGQHNGLHCRDLVARILGTVRITEAAERKARDFIAELRNEGHRICGHPASGYYIAANDRELNATCKFLLDRSQTTVNQVARMKGQFAPDLLQHFGVRH